MESDTCPSPDTAPDLASLTLPQLEARATRLADEIDGSPPHPEKLPELQRLTDRIAEIRGSGAA